MGDHNKRIAYVANNRAQVVRSHTDVTRDSSHVPYPPEPRSIDSLETFPNERVSHLPYCIEHLCPDTHFLPRKALTSFQCVRDFSVALPRIGEYSHCSFLLLILVLAIFFATSRQSFVSVQHQAAPLPQLLQSVGRQWVLSPSLRDFSADEHAPTVTTPRFTNCCGQRTFVDPHLHVCICHERPHYPERVVRISSPVNNKTSRINMALLAADAAA